MGGNSGNGGDDPTDTDDDTGTNGNSDGPTRTEVEGAPDLPEPLLSVGSYTCSEDTNPIDVTLENGELTFEGLADMDEYNNCPGIEPEVRWGGEYNEGVLMPELHVTDESITDDCPACEGPTYRHIEFTYTIDAPDDDYWTGEVILHLIDGSSERPLVDEEFDQ